MSDLSAKPEKNYRAKTKQADSQSGYLEDKVVGSTYINITEEDGTVGKRLKIELNMTGIAGGSFEDPFTGSTSKVPYSSAIRELLKALYITSATDCGSGGDSIMQKTQHIPASSITVMEKEGTNLIFSGDYPALSPAILDDSKWDTTAGCRSFGGMVKIKSINGGSAEAETSSFVIAVIPFGINEDAVGTNFWVDVLFYCPATGERDDTTVVGAVPFIFVGDGTDYPTPGSVVEKTINYDDEVGKVVYKTFEFTRGDRSTTASGGIIIMVNITDSTNFDAQILSARVRYETKTINLRKADVYEEV